MANFPSSIKRARQNIKRRQANGSHRSAMRTELRKATAKLASGSKEEAAKAYAAVVPVLDKAAGKLIHKNKAARHKSRLNKRLRALA